jgi:hypothetical protein
MKKADHAVIDSLKAAHQGERLFILGTGPSLLEADLGKLAQEYTFGVNFVMEVPGMFQPTFLGSSEQLGLVEILPSAAKRAPTSRKFIAHTYDLTTFETYHGQLDEWTWVYTHPSRYVESGALAGFGPELEWVGKSYSTVFTCALQLGIWMGFDPIYLVGCDNSGAHHAYDEAQVREKYNVESTRDIQTEQVRTKALLRTAHAAKTFMAEHGRQLWDCSPVGGLHIPRKTLSAVL